MNIVASPRSAKRRTGRNMPVRPVRKGRAIAACPGIETAPHPPAKPQPRVQRGAGWVAVDSIALSRFR